jgi:hypothetical protein
MNDETAAQKAAKKEQRKIKRLEDLLDRARAAGFVFESTKPAPCAKTIEEEAEAEYPVDSGSCGDWAARQRALQRAHLKGATRERSKLRELLGEVRDAIEALNAYANRTETHRLLARIAAEIEKP